MTQQDDITQRVPMAEEILGAIRSAGYRDHPTNIERKRVDAILSAVGPLLSKLRAPVADEHCSACNPQVFSVEQLEKDPLLVARLWRKPADTDGSLVERILEHVSEYGESMASSSLLSVRTIARRNLEARIEAELADAMRSQDESPLREALSEIASAWSARTRLPEEDGIQALKDIARAALASAPVAATFQARVQPWMTDCFGPTISADRQERNHRFIEEALELIQACGATASEAHQLVDYVFNRPTGEPAQEVGGVMVTLAALCLANGLDMHQAGDIELARISAPAIRDKIRAKQASKPKHSPLPESAPVAGEAQPLGYVRKGREWPNQCYYPSSHKPTDIHNWTPVFDHAAPQLSAYTGITTSDHARNAALEALEAAQRFIRNGIELGYIRMPDADTPDPAQRTPDLIDAAIRALKRPQADKDGGQQRAGDELINALGQCRDAFPIPDMVGSQLDLLWQEAMSDPTAVPAYVKACAARAALSAPQAEQGERDA
ncbi:hypothetical protein ACOTF2_18190 [Achromobacter xylosoxidans]